MTTHILQPASFIMADLRSSTDLLNDLIFELETSLSTDNAGNAGAKAGKVNKKGDSKPASKAAAAAAPVPVAAEKSALTVNGLDLRVGVIRTCVKHETAEKLYCEEIDVGGFCIL